MTSSATQLPDPDRDPFDSIVEGFVDQFRDGETPSLDELAEQNPELSNDVHELLPLVAMMEQWKLEQTAEVSNPVTLGGVMPEQLGDFRLIRRIGRGGMGMVFEAHQRSLDRKVAIKILPPASRLASDWRQRFYREARLAAGLHHPNIVTVYGVGESNGIHYIVMQLIHGLSISSIGNPMPPERVARLGIQAAKGLQYAHSQNVLHRDIKPANMLIDEHERLWLADFGLARAIEDTGMSQTGELAGTLMYLPPERTRGKCDAKSDIYSLGLSLYQLLLGIRPFRADNTAELLSQINAGTVERAPTVEAGVPRDLLLIIRKSFSLDPNDRYETAQALRDDLESYLSGRPVSARRLNPLERIGKWARRNPMIASLSTLVASLIACILVLSVIGYAQERQQNQRLESMLDTTLGALDRVYSRLAPQQFAASEKALASASGVTISTNDATPAPVTPETAELLDELLHTYNELSTNAVDNARIRSAVAIAHRRTGDIQSMLNAPGKAIEAYENANKASQLAMQDDQPRWSLFQAETYSRIAYIHGSLGDIQASETARSLAIETFGRVNDARFDEARKMGLASALLTANAFRSVRTGRPKPGRGRTQRQPRSEKEIVDEESWHRSVEEAIALLEPLCDALTPSPDARMLLAVALRERASFKIEDLRLNNEDVVRSIEILETLHQHHPERTDIVLELNQSLARVPPPHLVDSSEKMLAEERLSRSITLAEQLADKHVDVPQYRFVGVVAKLRLADFLMSRATRDAERSQKVSLEERFDLLSDSERTLTDLCERRPDYGLYAFFLLRTRIDFAEVAWMVGRTLDADASLALAGSMFERLANDNALVNSLPELRSQYDQTLDMTAEPPPRPGENPLGRSAR